jgi:hypothetical protein
LGWLLATATSDEEVLMLKLLPLPAPALLAVSAASLPRWRPPALEGALATWVDSKFEVHPWGSTTTSKVMWSPVLVLAGAVGAGVGFGVAAGTLPCCSVLGAGIGVEELNI